ncbi:MAG: 30S ribosomal protein S8 [Pseudomonadota bacterium]|nr:30S ribosomal protein S8 [Pseudomonadota bacterium]
MSLQDPLSDMFTRIRNGQQRLKVSVSMPSSNKKIAIAKVLESEGYIAGFETKEDARKVTLTVSLKYFEGKGVIESIKRISKPSLRQYGSKNDLPRVIGGLGIAIVSTSQGVMTDKEARAKGIGGEILCTVH